MVSLGVQFAPPFDTLTPITRVEPQPGVDRRRQAGRHGDGHPAGEERRRRAGNVHGQRRRARHRRRGHAEPVHAGPRRRADLHGEVHARRADPAPLGEWAFGALTWTGGGHTVRSPIAVEPVAVSAPTEVHVDASAAGSEDFDIVLGSAEPLAMSVAGLVGVDADRRQRDHGRVRHQRARRRRRHEALHGRGAGRHRRRRGSHSTPPTTPPTWTCSCTSDGEFVDLSASGAADEQVTLLDPAAGTYDVFVNGFTTPGGSTTLRLGQLRRRARPTPATSPCHRTRFRPARG